ncbi:hypothetical protein F0562_018695 [Nyssa sinensis]|uniref:A20-type domain-containing protein n=1 Tax=Nyssa sinensis TaxID=561372 RepID=A0A5J4ZD36_9ASTE|nr:hypothetical protein F0562_018695 [Nyssa sinensis]
MEQNEMGCQAAPEAPILCVNNCGFFGTAETMNMCSKCHKDMMLKQEQAKLAASSIENIVNGSSSTSGKESDIAVVVNNVQAGSSELMVVSTQESCASALNEKTQKVKEVHRYSDKHDCPVDYHTAAQDAIAKANPVVKAEKLNKI